MHNIKTNFDKLLLWGVFGAYAAGWWYVSGGVGLCMRSTNGCEVGGSSFWRETFFYKTF
jgi:hypothetical protein